MRKPIQPAQRKRRHYRNDVTRTTPTIRRIKAPERQDDASNTRSSGKRKPYQSSAKSEASEGRMRITYKRAPQTREERRQRRIEQRALAKRKRKNWWALTRAHRERRIRFGSHARCRNTQDVRDLATLNSRIAHEREMKAVKTWRLTEDQVDRLKRCIGFEPSDRLLASNKTVIVETAARLSRLMRRLHHTSKKNFYWITLINEDWHAQHNNTLIDLAGIHRLADTVLQPLGMDWFGMVEIDIFNNYPLKGKGLWITPHVHLLAWSKKRERPSDIEARLFGHLLTSTLGAKTVKVKTVSGPRGLAHLSYYMTKPRHQCKSLGRFNRLLGRHKLWSPDLSVRPGQTRRLAEILSRMTIDELMLAHGDGERIKRRLLRSLALSPALSPDPRHAIGSVGEAWWSMMPAWRRDRAFVRIKRTT